MDFSVRRLSLKKWCSIGMVMLFCNITGSLASGFPNESTLDLFGFELKYQKEASITVAAQRQQLVLDVTSDAMTGKTQMHVLLGDGAELAGIRYSTESGKASQYTLSQLASGVVVFQKSGRDVLKLVGKNLSPQHGGEFNLVYLTNGITNSYEQFEMQLVRKGDRWVLETVGQNGRVEFTSMFLEANTFLGQVIGIDRVVVE